MNAISRNCSILGLLIAVGCAMHVQPGILGRWTVVGADNVVTLAKDHSTRVTSGVNTVGGRYRMVAHDVLELTLPGGASPLEERITILRIPPDDYIPRSSRVPVLEVGGRWTVSGTDNIVTLTMDPATLQRGWARLTSGGRTVSGSYRMVAHDLLSLTIHDDAWAPRQPTVHYTISREDRLGRSLRRFPDTILVGRWTVSATDDVVTLNDWDSPHTEGEGLSASLKSGGKIITGSYRCDESKAPELLILTLHDGASTAAQRTITYRIPAGGGWESRSLQRLSDTTSEIQPVTK